MESAIKNTVKEIFKTNTFENALDLTRNLRGEYIRELGVKSWNALVTYYKKADIHPAEELIAEPETTYEDECSKGSPSQDEGQTSKDNVDGEEMGQIKDERIEYMLYSNPEDKVEWFGHRENFYGLKTGDTARMIRMNNKGVSEGRVVATASLTLDHINLYHRCYAVIIRMKRTYREQLELAAKCLINLAEAVTDFNRVPASDVKLTDYVLNFKRN